MHTDTNTSFLEDIKTNKIDIELTEYIQHEQHIRMHSRVTQQYTTTPALYHSCFIQVERKKLPLVNDLHHHISTQG